MGGRKGQNPDINKRTMFFVSSLINTSIFQTIVPRDFQSRSKERKARQEIDHVTDGISLSLLVLLSIIFHFFLFGAVGHGRRWRPRES